MFTLGELAEKYRFKYFMVQRNLLVHLNMRDSIVFSNWPQAVLESCQDICGEKFHNFYKRMRLHLYPFEWEGAAFEVADKQHTLCAA